RARSRTLMDRRLKSRICTSPSIPRRRSMVRSKHWTRIRSNAFGGPCIRVSMMWGSLLATGGGLVFGGGTNDRLFRVYDANSGEELWHFRTNSGIIAPPSTFEVNGVQYIAVQSGYGVDPAFQQGLMAELVGWQKDVPQGGVVWVFAVSK